MRLVEKIPEELVFEDVRQTPLMCDQFGKNIATDQNVDYNNVRDRLILPYEGADVRLEIVNPLDVNPTSYYGLNKCLEKQRFIRETIQRSDGIDTLLLGTGNNPAGLILEDGGIYYVMMPVVTEYPMQGFGNPSRIQMNDGHHRLKLAIECQSSMSTISVNGVRIPFYAFANLEGHEQFVMGNNVPNPKKLFTTPNNFAKLPYELYRNFNHGGVLPEFFTFLLDNIDKGYDPVLVSTPR